MHDAFAVEIQQANDAASHDVPNLLFRERSALGQKGCRRPVPTILHDDLS